MCGLGAYAASSGECTRGRLNRYGLLHGEGVHARPGESTHVFAGEFRDGALWGRGVEVHATLGRSVRGTCAGVHCSCRFSWVCA